MNCYSSTMPLPALVHLPQKRRCKSVDPVSHDAKGGRFHPGLIRLTRSGNFKPRWRDEVASTAVAEPTPAQGGQEAHGWLWRAVTGRFATGDSSLA